MRTQHTRRVGEPVSAARVAARLAGLTVAGSSTVATVRLPGGATRDVVLAGAPDAALARRLSAGFRRVSWVRIDAGGRQPHCELFGMTRCPRRARLPLSAALALADAGAPTVVRVPAAAAGEG
ncbi:MAG: hypothetical protein KY452_02015 [Actinobacteria bacterium]|nr:hypothetical protein [Actinomycetota bacterium]